jgi:uncharacterized protein (DUF2252 family)
LPGVDFTVDLKRLAASVALAALDANMPAKKARGLAKATVQSYREFILELATKTPLEVWCTRMEIDREVKGIADDKLREKIFSTLVKAKKDLAADDNFPHLAVTKAGVAHIEDRPPLIYHFDTEATKGYQIHAHSAFANYRGSLLPERRALMERYMLSDIAFKVVGVGSVGTFCAIGLFMTADAEPLFLQVKQALASVLEKIAAPPPGLVHQGCRVAEGQRAMQAASDIFLGVTEKTQRPTGSFTFVNSRIATSVRSRSSKARRSIPMRTFAAGRLPAHTRAAATLSCSPAIWENRKRWTTRLLHSQCPMPR